jgi:hypothetical protein
VKTLCFMLDAWSNTLSSLVIQTRSCLMSSGWFYVYTVIQKFNPLNTSRTISCTLMLYEDLCTGRYFLDIQRAFYVRLHWVRVRISCFSFLYNQVETPIKKLAKVLRIHALNCCIRATYCNEKPQEDEVTRGRELKTVDATDG